MPFAEIVTRHPVSQEIKAKLARNLSEAITKIEVGMVTDGARSVDWMWFRTLPDTDWAVGGEFGNAYTNGRTMAFAHLIVPEAFMNTELRTRAIKEVTEVLREGLQVPDTDDGLGIWINITEVPRGYWGASSKPSLLPALIKLMDGEVSEARLAEIDAHFDGYDRMKDQFGIPS